MMTEPVGTKKPSTFSCLANVSGVGIPGLEPGKTGPESVVLPLHHIPMNYICAKERTSVSFSFAVAKVQNICNTPKKIPFFF